MEQQRHLWVRGHRRTDRIQLLAGLDVPPVLAVLDAHRRLRGPYTAAGSLLRQLVPLALQRWPSLVARHHTEIVAAAPELAELMPVSRAAAEVWTLPPGEYTQRLANGLAEFLIGRQRAAGGAVTVMVDNLQHADQTDLELVDVLLRRVHPELITLVSGTTLVGSDRVAELLGQRCLVFDASPTPPAADPAPQSRRRAAGLALDQAAADQLGASFVASDGTSDDTRLLLAYQRLPAARRAQLHDQRAEELERCGELSWRLGALPWHRELGRSPGKAGTAALRFAADHCVRLGFHHAAAELAVRGRVVVDPGSRPQDWWAFTTILTLSQAVLGRGAASLRYPHPARSAPSASRHLAVVDAVREAAGLPEGDDRHGMLAWLAGATRLSGTAAVAVLELGRQAVSELRRPNHPRVLTLVDQALAQLSQGPAWLRADLLGCRARVHRRLRSWEDALADQTEAVGLDPTRADRHHERAVTLQRLGRHLEALAGFDRAIALSPPFAQAYLARSDSRREAGNHDGAIADLCYVLELRPGDLDALTRRAVLLQSCGRHQEAVAAFDALLAVVDDQDARRGRELSVRLLDGAGRVHPAVPHPR